MPRDKEHLILQQWQEPLPKRKSGGGSNFARENKNEHGRALVQQTENLSQNLQSRQRTYPQGINPKLVFKIRLNASGNIEEGQLESLGLRILSKDENKIFVVFPDDATLRTLRGRLREYAGLVPDGHKYDFFSNIDEILELEPEDRVGVRLQNQPLLNDEVTNLDIEIWYYTREECEQKIQELREFLASRNLRLTDSWIGRNICLARARINSETLELLLNIDYIKEIDRRPSPAFEIRDVSRLSLDQINIDSNISNDSPGILIIDSGIMQGHPLLGFILGDAQVFPDSLRQRIVGGAEDGDTVSGGHGTAVAGIAAYGDLGNCINNRVFNPQVQLFSARVTDHNNEYDEEELVEHQYAEAITYFLDNYPTIKVVNISLGNDTNIYRNRRHQFKLAAVIDEIAYEFSDRNVVFVISSGNYVPDELSDEEIFNTYPDYLLNSEDSKIIDPGTSAIALTVGGISNGLGQGLGYSNDDNSIRLVGRNKNWPSPFTRTGMGVNGAIKPDLVEVAGDWIFERGRINNHPGSSARESGVPTTSKNFAPPEGSLFRTVIGTSFSSPKVANLVALLFREFPNASPNLIRALLANSAEIPDDKPPRLASLDQDNDDILRIYGYGIPSFERARWSASNEVLLLDDSEIAIDHFKIYEIPPLPEQFLNVRGKKYISVTLAFDPPTRYTRGDSYIGVALDFALYKNVNPETLVEVLRALSSEERQHLEEENQKPASLSSSGIQTVHLLPGTRKRSKGTLQKGIHKITYGNRWSYDHGPLYLSVSCLRKWAPIDITHQRYSILVSLQHENPEIDIYNQIRQHTRVFQRIRVSI